VSARARRWTTAVLVAAPFVILLVGAWQYRWMADHGHGPVFNAGERVEASTSPLWLWLLTIEDVVLPIRLEWIAVLTGIALTLAGAAATVLGAMRLGMMRSRTGPSSDDTRPAIWFPVGLLVLVVIAPTWRFASSGLENGLTVAWIGACLLVMATWARDGSRLRPWLAIVLGLGPVVRPELTVVSVLLLGTVLALQWSTDTWRSRVATLVAAFAVPIAYQVFRMGYYASLVPNSAVAKEASRSYWSAGWDYLRHAFDPYWLWLPIALIVVGAYVPLLVGLRRDHATRSTVVAAVFGAAALVDAIYIVRVGGDFMQARLLLPALWLLMAPVAVVPITRRFVVALLVVPWALVVLVSVRSQYDAPVAFIGHRNAVTVEDFGIGPNGRPAWFSGQGAYYLTRRLPGKAAPHDPVIAEYGVGLFGYALGPDTYVLDLLGLGDSFTSHLALAHRGTVAHEKPLPTPWIPARTLAPGAPVTQEMLAPPQLFFAIPIDNPKDQPFATRVTDARRALRCGALREFLDRTTGSLSVGDFVGNVFAAPGATRFRIPPEPRDAVARFCR